MSEPLLTVLPVDVALFDLTVVGLPAPQGSKRHVGGGRMVESSKNVKPWRQAVVAAAYEARARGHAPFDMPLDADFVFSFFRPGSHFGTGRNAGVLKASARPRPSVTPDLSKLVRSTEDALTDAGIYRDDALIVGFRQVGKWYTTDHPRVDGVLPVAGATIRLYPAVDRTALEAAQ